MNGKIDTINHTVNDIKYAIRNKKPIEAKLNVIVVISNPCLYKRRYVLLRELIKRMEEEETHVELFIVEMAYTNQYFCVTDKNNKNHLQLNAETPLWHKENMVNLAVKYLLPKNYKAFAWIDADIEFESSSWALDTLKILNGCKNVVQLFSHAVNMTRSNMTINIVNGFGYNLNKNKPFSFSATDYWHPGYAWAMTREVYEKIGGLFDKCIVGGGDHVMVFSFTNKCHHIINNNYNRDYIISILEYQSKASQIKMGYTPGVIRHHYHGSVQNRKHTERHDILINHDYSPNKHLKYNDKGILVPSAQFSNEFKEAIMNYFLGRKEDD